jgi:amino acid adenylation domain-containing protein
MDDPGKLIANLTPEKRALLERHLLNKAKNSSLTKRGIQRRGTADSCVLSFAQQRLWLFDQLEPRCSGYNIPLAIRMHGRLSVSALQQSIGELIKRHEVLRTTFSTESGQPVQRTKSATSITLQQSDLSALPEEQREAKLQQLVSEELSRPFDLAVGPLMRTILVRLNPQEHVLLMTIHHIATDGWSMGILYRELSDLYEAARKGHSSPLPELPIQYADFAVWQREWLKGKKLEEQVAFWKENLRNLTTLQLPTDHPRPSVPAFNAAKHSVEFPQAITKSLQELNRNEGTTLFMTLLAAFQILLHRYTGQDDVVVGTAVANRNREEIEGLLGFFVNTLVMRADTSGDPAFRELLKRVRKSTLDAYEHQDLPFERLVEELHPTRVPGRNPLFQALFVLQNTPVSSIRLPELTMSLTSIKDARTTFDLEVHLHETPEGLKCSFVYRTDLFERGTIERMATHYQRILEGVVANPDQRLSELPLLTDGEKQQLLEEWNDTSADYPKGKCVHEVFEEQVELTPKAIAVAFRNERITYQELNRRANQVAHYLRKYGVGPKTLVGICIERSIEMVVGLLGILKAGAAYLPLDHAYPKERLGFMLGDSKVSVLLTEQNLLERLPEHQTHVICMDADWATISRMPVTNLTKTPTADSLSYVVYTSGSTGKPKGVQISHQSVVNFLTSMRQKPGLTKNDVVLAVTTLCFDIAGLEIYLPLTTGATLVLVSRDVPMDGSELMRELDCRDATFMQATPATWRLLLESGWEGNPKLKILCGGEAWSQDLAEQLLPRCKSLWNMYGPTETTIWSAVQQIQYDQRVLIGRPIANTQFYIVDSSLQILPIGAPGELLIGGDGVSTGYLNRTELTDEKFIPNPFRNARGVQKLPDSHVYRTGDLARYLPSGEIECLGRIDNQVKIRGYRIELGEIENVLSRHPAVKRSAATVDDSEPGNPRLSAYIVPVKDSQLSPVVLRSFLQRELSGYMVPSAFHFLDALPLTPNGKVDRKALQTIVVSTPRMESTPVLPRNDTEKALGSIWSKLLRVNCVSIKEDFFDLGGHSLLAVRLFSEIEKQFGKTLPLSTLFQARTIEQLANVIHKEVATSRWPSLAPIQDRGSRPPLFLVHGAEGNVLMYRELALHLGEDQPVYGLQYRGLDGREPFLETFEEMAAIYVREIKTMQPQGPYFLGGYCLGGAIALEMAQQLRAAGEEVGLVAMLETYNLDYIRQSPSRLLTLRRRLQNVYFHLKNLLMIKSDDRTRFLSAKWKVARERQQIKLTSWLRLFSRRPGAGGAIDDIHLEVARVNDKAALRYVPKPYSDPVVLFRPREFFQGLNNPTFGWGDLLQPVLEVVKLPFYAKGMLVEPFVETLATELNLRLSYALEKGRSDSVDSAEVECERNP